MIGASWLVDDLLRVEELLVTSAGASDNALVSAPSLHLLRAGGKRLRPALVLVSSRAGTPGARATDLAAAAVELVHLATLYHDDVIDGTETRRGARAVHVEWGLEVAVLAGDYLFASACGLGAEAGGEVSAILARAIQQVCEGQIIETGALNDPRRPAQEYIDTIALKTAALFKASCELGAATSGAAPSARRALESYGTNLGLAFQIVDDLLDLVGDPEATGKAVGTDLKEGVFTLPILIATARDAALAERLAAGERDVESVVAAVQSTGALQEAHETAASYGRTAKDALSALPEGEWRAHLDTIVDGVLAQIPERSLV